MIIYIEHPTNKCYWSKYGKQKTKWQFKQHWLEYVYSYYNETTFSLNIEYFGIYGVFTCSRTVLKCFVNNNNGACIWNIYIYKISVWISSWYLCWFIFASKTGNIRCLSNEVASIAISRLIKYTQLLVHIFQRMQKTNTQMVYGFITHTHTHMLHIHKRIFITFSMYSKNFALPYDRCGGKQTTALA